MVTPTFLPYFGGQEVYVRKLSENLAKRGHEVTIFTTDAVSRIPFKRAFAERQESGAYTVLRFPCQGFLYSYVPIAPRFILAVLSKSITNHHVVHVHGFGHVTSDVAALMRRIFRVPVVLTTHGLHQETGQRGFVRSLFWYYYRETCVRITLHTVDRILTLSPDESRYLARFGPNVESKVTVVPIGVATEEFLRFAGKTPSPTDRPMVLYVGRIYPGKGLNFLIEAISSLKSYNPLVVLAGERTEYVSVLQELAKKLGVDRNVVFTGFVDEEEKSRLLSEASVFCLPSKYEGASLATLEAMAAGTPIVATRTGGLQYLVRDGSSGFLVRYGRADEIALSLEKIITNPLLRDEMGKRASATAKDYEWTTIAARIEEIYEEVIRESHSRMAREWTDSSVEEEEEVR